MANSKPSRTLDDVSTLPSHPQWEFEPETNTQAHWTRKDVPVDELAEDSKAFGPEDYEEIGSYYHAYSMTLSHESGEKWSVSFTSPNPQRGMGDYDNRFSVTGVSLDDALKHVKKTMEQKSG